MKRTIKVDYLARVEGEGSLAIELSEGRAESVKLNIFEPPRFFEAFLQGRGATEAPDITARICGICPVAYQMSACHAVEAALGVKLPEPLRRLRRLLYTGEWIQSHALHVFMLHAPDFLGYADALAMAKEHPELVKQGLFVKRTGNAILRVLGGREVHPINVKVGGFYRLPRADELSPLLADLERARETMEDSLRFFSRLAFPDFERDYEFVALHHPHDYPFCEGRIVSSAGLDIAAADYEDHFVEEQVPHSTALHARLLERGAYLCGPLSRLNLNFDRLRTRARAVADEIGFFVPCNNPFKSLLARGIEIVQALDEAHAIVEAYDASGPASVETPLCAGVGHGATEAPRGLLYHRYAIDAAGAIEQARIVPPTSQNQRSMEEDLAAMAPRLASLPHAEATWLAEQSIRNYDPCISCSTHFLRLKLAERGSA